MKIEIECKLKEIMKEEKLNPTKIAATSGLSRTIISSIANGKKCNLETALLISEAVKRPVNEIWLIIR